MSARHSGKGAGRRTETSVQAVVGTDYPGCKVAAVFDPDEGAYVFISGSGSFIRARRDLNRLANAILTDLAKSKRGAK